MNCVTDYPELLSADVFISVTDNSLQGVCSTFIVYVTKLLLLSCLCYLLIDQQRDFLNFNAASTELLFTVQYCYNAKNK